MNWLKLGIGSFLRWALSGVAGWLIAKGVITAEQGEAAIGTISTAIAMLLVSLIWSLANKYGLFKRITTALDLKPGATLEDLERAVKK